MPLTELTGENRIIEELTTNTPIEVEELKMVLPKDFRSKKIRQPYNVNNYKRVLINTVPKRRTIGAILRRLFY